MKHYGKFYINGEWVEPTESRTLELVNPANEAPFATVSLGGAKDVDRAVAAARNAFASFSGSGKAARIELLEQIVRKLEAREPEIMAAITTEMGSPITQKAQTGSAVAAFRQAAAILRDYEFESRLGPNIIRREPIGVCGLITPWNWPLQTLVTKLAASIAAGCPVVVKPSEITPVSAILLTDVLHEAGIPAGTFNLVNGDGPGVGHAISTHPGIDMVSFTGSTRAGIMIAQAAAATVKRVCQELGGKSAHVVLPDADLQAAARFNIARGFSNSAQSCHAPSRMLVQREQLPQVVEFLKQEVSKIKVGDPLDPATTMGPVANGSQFDKIQKYIEGAIAEGARLVCGGPGRPEGIERGFFIRPTVFADVTPQMTIAREEIFGPVLAVMAYSTVDEAIQIANDTPYGLGGYVYSSDPAKGMEVGKRLRAGRIFCNGAPSNLTAPMGGYKQSGNGREVGVFGIEEYLEVKAMIGFDAPATA